MNLTAWPRLSAYLSSLPDGERSYPECQARGSIARSYLEGRQPAADAPAGLARYAGELPRNNAWVPEVDLAMIWLYTGDRAGMDDAALRQWIRQTNHKMLGSLIFQVALNVVSIGMLLEIAASRWSTMHKGTTLELLESGKGSGRVRLAYPAGLFTPPVLELFCEVFHAIVERARAKEPSVRVEEVTPEAAVFKATWQP